MLRRVQVSQGVPTLAQDILEDPRLEAAAQRCGMLRRMHARLLAPPEFSTPRNLSWHGAGPGAPPCCAYRNARSSTRHDQCLRSAIDAGIDAACMATYSATSHLRGTKGNVRH